MKITCAVDEIRSLTSDEIKALLDKDKKGEYLLLDVRQPEEYEAGHIPGATLIPLGELEARQEELDRNRKIITYCRSGHRSMAAAIALCGLGFTGVQHLDGGILSWPYETIAGIPEARPELITEGAEIYHGPGLDWKYGSTLRGGQEFEIGNLKITAIHTPGHTDESMSYSVLINHGSLSMTEELTETIYSSPSKSLGQEVRDD